MHRLVYQASCNQGSALPPGYGESERYRLCHILNPSIVSGALASAEVGRKVAASKLKHGKRKAGTNTYPAEQDSLWSMLYHADGQKRDTILKMAKAACDRVGIPYKFFDDAISHIEHGFLRTNAAVDKEGNRRNRNRSELLALGKMVAQRQALLYMAHNGFACKLNDEMMYSGRTEKEAKEKGEAFDPNMRLTNFYCDSLDEKEGIDAELSVDFDEESAVSTSGFSVERLPPEVLTVISKLKAELDYGMQTFLDHLLAGESPEKAVEMLGISGNNSGKYMERLAEAAGKMSEEDRMIVFAEFGWRKKRDA